MTVSQEQEFNLLGCKVKYKPSEKEGPNAMAVIELVGHEIDQLKSKRPLLRDTDIAVLIALKFATEKLELENEYKTNIHLIEKTLKRALEPSTRAGHVGHEDLSYRIDLCSDSEIMDSEIMDSEIMDSESLDEPDFDSEDQHAENVKSENQNVGRAEVSTTFRDGDS